MREMVVYDNMYDTYIMRIDKKRARSCYNMGLPVMFCPVNMQPAGVWHIGVYIDPAHGESEDTFDSRLNCFEYYNCNYEYGYYTAFYVPVMEYKQDINEPFVVGEAPQYVYNYPVVQRIRGAE